MHGHLLWMEKQLTNPGILQQCHTKLKGGWRGKDLGERETDPIIHQSLIGTIPQSCIHSFWLPLFWPQQQDNHSLGLAEINLS